MESGELVARFIATTAQLDKLQGTLFEHAMQAEHFPYLLRATLAVNTPH
jgi:hypothetical protein